MFQKMQQVNSGMFHKVQQMMNGKSENELKEMAQNIAKERGIDLNKFASQFGMKILLPVTKFNADSTIRM